MSTAVSDSFATLKSVAGVSAVLIRGESQSTVTVVPGASIADVQNVDGSFQRTESRDYIITASDYAFDGVIVRPLSGDLFEVSEGSSVKIYEVAPFAGTECYRESDRYGNQLRVHCRLRGIVNTSDDNVQRSITGVLPQADGDTDAADRRHAAGTTRLYE